MTTGADADPRWAAIVAPGRHLRDGGGAAEMIGQQAATLRAFGLRLALVAVAPAFRAGRRMMADDRDAIEAQARRAGFDRVAFVEATRPLHKPAALTRAIAARPRGDWTPGVQFRCMMAQIRMPSTRMGHEPGSSRERQHCV